MSMMTRNGVLGCWFTSHSGHIYSGGGHISSKYELHESFGYYCFHSIHANANPGDVVDHVDEYDN